ncbi:uncharacterized protein [Nicotiana tomentosiformis]|uniref:uncharacterized protein n=1 Tax=Nicotiana tomentosiformis TaxID=4098 RepID=UPI00388C3E7A
MNEVNVSCLFNKAQQALKQASILHHEIFLWYRVEVNQLELEVRELAQKKDTYKLLSEQQEGVIKDLQDELDRDQKEASVLQREHTDLVEKLEPMRSQLETTSADIEEMVAQYKVDIEEAKARLKTNAEYVRRLSRRETLEEIHARGFDLSVKIEEAKKLEVVAEHEGDEGSEGSKESEGPNGSGDKSVSNEDQA